MADNHRCPGPGCTVQVDPGRLACPHHWYQVSRDTRTRVWRAWDNGWGAGTAEHADAIMAAIAEMRR